jgi:transposase
VISKLDPFREYLLSRVLGEGPVTNAEVLYDEIRERGYEGGRTILKEFLRPFRQLVREKVTRRFETPPGRQAQVDWGVFKKPERRRVQGFLMTLGWSRAMYLDFTETRPWPPSCSARTSLPLPGRRSRGNPLRPRQDGLAAG